MRCQDLLLALSPNWSLITLNKDASQAMGYPGSVLFRFRGRRTSDDRVITLFLLRQRLLSASVSLDPHLSWFPSIHRFSVTMGKCNKNTDFINRIRKMEKKNQKIPT